MIDTDNSGQITFEELRDGLKRFGANLNESEIYDLMQAVSIYISIILLNWMMLPIAFDRFLEKYASETKICNSTYFLHPTCLWIFNCSYANVTCSELQADVDNSGTIDYGEFIAATLHLNKVEREDHLFAAFSYFDKDGSGYITQDELQQACEEFGIVDVHLEELIREVDQDNVSTSVAHRESKLRTFWSFTWRTNFQIRFFLLLFPGWSDRLQRVRCHDEERQCRFWQEGPSYKCS